MISIAEKGEKQSYDLKDHSNSKEHSVSFEFGNSSNSTGDKLDSELQRVRSELVEKAKEFRAGD